LLTPSPSADPAAPRQRNLPSLTGLRFFAALLVFLTHSMLTVNPLKPTTQINFFADPDVANALATIFGQSAFMGVSFFFILSGFVLTWSTPPGDGVFAFWRRRLLKIFPNHVVMWVACLVLFAAAYTPFVAWLPSLFLVQSFFPVLTIFTAVNPPAWSLCCELLFYMLFPLLIIPIRRLARNRLWLGALGAVAGIVAVDLFTVFVLPDAPLFPGLRLSFPQQWFSYTFPPARLFEFILGMMLARIVQERLWPNIGKLPIFALAALGYLGTIVAPPPYSFGLVTAVPLSAVICAVATADLRGARTFLHSPVMIWLGNISFGFYLCQAVVIWWGRPRIFGDGTFGIPAAIGLEIVLFGLTILAGWLLYAGVERPVMRRWSRKRRPTVRSTPAAPVSPAPALPPTTPAALAPAPTASPAPAHEPG
jgi:peptidoglycan/LPS O-acetylase OafA/YrhL